jgi:serine/threonine-protein kinase
MSAGTLRRSTLGSYRLVDFLGAGGMGEVYRASHLSTGQVVAVKVLTASTRNPSLAERFRNEARIHSTLVHPHIVRLFEYFEADGFPCIAMEYVTGESLEHLIANRQIPLGRTLPLFSQVVDAVGYVHQRGIVHRDLKCSNIRIDEQGQVRLLDFGIARAGDSPKLTTDGSMVGTLHYLSPEQVRGATATPASDIWALGVVLYEMVTGRVPFDSDTLTGIMTQILSGRYEPPVRDGSPAPRPVARIIARCLEVDPGRRYASAEALLTDVRAAIAPASPVAPLGRLAIQPRPSGEFAAILRRRAPLWGSIGVAVVALGFLMWSLSGEQCCPPPPPPADTLRFVVRDTTRPAVREADHATVAALRPVIIRVFGEAPAQVFRGDSLIGNTPVHFEARIGDWIELTLRRPGHAERKERFQVIDGTNEYTYDLTRIGPSDNAAPASDESTNSPAD